MVSISSVFVDKCGIYRIETHLNIISQIEIDKVFPFAPVTVSNISKKDDDK